MNVKTKLLSVVLVLTMMLGLTACASSSSEPNSSNATKPSAEGKANVSASPSQTAKSDTQPEKSKDTKGIKVKVTVGQEVLTATLIDNATTRSLISKFPLTVPMMNLYSREMVYRFPDSLPANEAQTSGYEVGDISYWTPRHSFVIFYEQNGEVISNLQKIGRFDSDVKVFKQIKEADVKFELME